MSEKIYTKNAPDAIGPYSQAVKYVYNKPELLTYCAGLYVAEEDKEQEKEQTA